MIVQNWKFAAFYGFLYIFFMGKNILEAKRSLVACVGDSITFGTGSSSPTSTYPAKLSHYLEHHHNYSVKNFGSKGTTVTKTGDFPYVNTSDYAAAFASNPSVVVILFGMNDAKIRNWNQTLFVADYIDLIKRFQSISSKPVIFICTPAPFYADSPAYGIQGNVVNRVLPQLIPMIANKTNANVIDIFSTLGGTPFNLTKPYLFMNLSISMSKSPKVRINLPLFRVA